MKDQISVEEFRKKPKKKGKYGNKKTVIGNVSFDSAKEARHYAKLKAMQDEGIISELELQKKFELIPAQYEAFQIQGKRKVLQRKKCVEKACSYVADFVYKDKDGKEIVEDVKGMKTQIYRLKKKLMLSVHNIKIVEI